MMAASPAQNASGEIPVLGAGFLGNEIKQDRSDLQSVGIDTIHDGDFLTRNGVSHAVFWVKKQKNGAAMGIAVPGLLAPKRP